MPRASFAHWIVFAGASLSTAAPAAACMTAPRAVFFSQGSAELDETGRATVQDFVRSFAGDYAEGSVVLLRAYGDAPGTRPFDRVLPARRARAVGDVLAALGLPMEKIVLQVAGEGPSPVDGGASEPRNHVVWLQEMKLGSRESTRTAPAPPLAC